MRQDRSNINPSGKYGVQGELNRKGARSKDGASGVQTSDVEAFIRGDMDGFREVYSRYRDRIFGYCLYYMGDRTIAEDAFQEVFARAYTHRTQLREAGALTSWLLMITRSVCLNMLRSQKAAPHFVTIDERDIDEGSYDRHTNDPADRDLVDDELLRALARMAPIYRDALLLSEFEGYSYEEIAKMTEVTIHNVQVRVARAKKMLHEWLRPDDTPVTRRRKIKHNDESMEEALQLAGIITSKVNSI